MNEIAVALDWREIDVKQIGAELRFRFFGLRADVLSWFPAACTTVAGLAIADAVTPELGPSVNGALAVLAGALVLKAQLETGRGETGRAAATPGTRAA